MNSRSLLLSSAALLGLSSASYSQPVAQPPVAAATASAAQPVDDTADEEEIVVTGQRARGSVVGDIPPENTLSARDVRATGAAPLRQRHRR